MAQLDVAIPVPCRTTLAFSQYHTQLHSNVPAQHLGHAQLSPCTLTSTSPYSGYQPLGRRVDTSPTRWYSLEVVAVVGRGVDCPDAP